MKRNHLEGSDNNSRYLYHTVSYTSEYKYTYTWYEQHGVKRMEIKEEKLEKPRTVTSNQTKAAVQKAGKKTKPTNIPATTSEQPQKAEKPVLSVAKPAPVGEFQFEKQAPTLQEISVPQPPPPPGPKPVFQKPGGESTSKYEYLYGIKHLEIKHLQYSNKSVYVSKPIAVSGNVMSVSLHATEEHPLFDDLSGQAADRQTSIEYYLAPISNNPSPTLEDWKPILPAHVRDIKSELLLFGTARTATLRFPALLGASKPPAVYKNGMKMEEDEWSFIESGFGMQLLVEKDPIAIYTIDYTPNQAFYNPWEIDVSESSLKPMKHAQVFEGGTNHNKTVVLEKYPYVNYSAINQTDNYNPNTSSYVPIKVTLKDAGIIGQNRTIHKDVLPYQSDAQPVFTKNVTNYKTGTHEPLKSYSIDPDARYGGFDYYHEGNKLFFSETFNRADIHTNQAESHGNANIAVEYEYLASDFRVKIILRRNSTNENTLTPIVHDYTLKFKVMK